MELVGSWPSLGAASSVEAFRFLSRGLTLSRRGSTSLAGLFDVEEFDEAPAGIGIGSDPGEEEEEEGESFESDEAS